MLKRRFMKKTLYKIIRIKKDYEVLHYQAFQQVCLPGSSERMSHQLLQLLFHLKK